MSLENSPGLSGLPMEILEMICKNLSFSDIANIERSDRTLRDKITNNSLIWRKQAERINTVFKFSMISRMITKVKSDEDTTEPDRVKKYKIILGLAGIIKKHMRTLSTKEKSLSDELQSHISSHSAEDMTQASANMELINKMVKLYISLEVTRAMMLRIVTMDHDVFSRAAEEPTISGAFDPEQCDIPDSRVEKLLSFKRPISVQEEIEQFDDQIDEWMSPREDDIGPFFQAKSRTVISKIFDQLLQVE